MLLSFKGTDQPYSQAGGLGVHGLVGFREQVISDGPEQCGVHVEGNSSEDIAWGIAQCLQDPRRATEWGVRAHAHALPTFT
ncbi:MAG TPA: hypothetical protein QGG37_07735 [Chloroflexota bacterium]|nr:hypothetical protein [Chloroflexota bacterium]